MTPPDTKARILDAAERLFARDGFHCTSLRTITSEAGVNLAAVNYHFGSKEALIEAVFERRLLPLNIRRKERLERVRAEADSEGSPPEVEKALRAFIEPTVHFCQSCEGSRAFVTLVSRALAEPDDSVRQIFIRMMLPVLLLLFETLRQALPRLDSNVLFWRLHFALGAMGHVLSLDGKFQSLPSLPVEVSSDASVEAVSELLVPFICAGMEVE